MEANIIYAGQSDEEVLKEVTLLWTSILFFEYIFYTGSPVDAIDSLVEFPLLNEKAKLNVIEKSMIKFGVSNEYLNEFKRFCKTLQEAKSMRGKNQQLLVQTQKMQKSRDAFDDNIIQGLKNTLIKFNLSEIEPLISLKGSSKTQPVSVIALATAMRKSDSVTPIKLIKTVITDEYSLPIFHSMQSLAPPELTLNQISTSTANTTYLSDFFLEIPFPCTLTLAQVMLLREQMSATSWKLMDTLHKVKKQFADIAFTPENYTQLSSIYTTAANELKTQLNKQIEENNLLSELKSQHNKKPDVTVYIGICSFSNLISLYNKLKIIPDTTELYTKEELSTTLNLNNTTLFLYTK